MGLFDRGTNALREEVAGLRGDIRALTEEKKAASKALALTETVIDLETQISSLKADRSRIEEAYARKERETKEKHDRSMRDIEHMLGLHKKQVAHETSASKRETAVEIREGNLAHERAAFEEQMKFFKEQSNNQVEYLRELIALLSERLPAIEIGGTLRFADSGDLNADSE